MSKGFRVLLQIFQTVGLVGTLLFLTSSLLWYIADFDLTGLAEDSAPVELWAVGFGVLTLALSPALWSLSRVGGQAPAAQSAGTFDRVQAPNAVPSQPQQQPGGVFEPMQASQAPAPPSSSYGQPSAGGITPTSSPQAGSPWGGGR
ncbi:hypothetical protein [Glycomyces algeriensis]|uniref:Uncharacterized protein n=1 Tax=Glycomyces algeriensis TaxID=256037 RepID=A0A9W6G8G5_9ACTN|nr:hypothetical protein [Glycomyces algeriensis]MDA1365237.1 hypothetical protein [Glycomyces algeriensis]MDR7349699.1 hypothetical protein [Glycomyces algeriensis]GLI42411.1 hypothetical protein GALLR39Z86_22610 [Glycomyces algeriensis]